MEVIWPVLCGVFPGGVNPARTHGSPHSGLLSLGC